MSVRLKLLAAARSSSLLATRFDDDRPLDAAGWHEAERAAPVLCRLAAAELRYCSPSARCRETGEALGLSPLAQPALRDCDMGRWRGRTLGEVTAAEPRAVETWLADPGSAPHGGSRCWPSSPASAAGWTPGRSRTPPSLLAVAEPGVVRAALLYALQAPPHSYWRINVQPLSVTTLTRRSGKWDLQLEA